MSVRNLIVRALAILAAGILGIAAGSLVSPTAHAVACEYDACRPSVGNCAMTDVAYDCDETDFGCDSTPCPKET